jgi:hypothetical protein
MSLAFEPIPPTVFRYTILKWSRFKLCDFDHLHFQLLLGNGWPLFLHIQNLCHYCFSLDFINTPNGLTFLSLIFPFRRFKINMKGVFHNLLTLSKWSTLFPPCPWFPQFKHHSQDNNFVSLWEHV